MSTVLEQVEDVLKRGGYEYRLIEHEPAGSAEEYQRTLNTRLEQQAKALFLRVRRGKEKSYAVLAIQAQKQADLWRAARALGASEVKLAQASQLKEVTGCEFGELPPFGTPFGLPLLVDRDLLDEAEIYFNVGSLSQSIAMSPRVLLELENPTLY